jgi:DNA-binding transcriptional LysR family regulator
MDLVQLETFLAVAEEGSFSRAARRLRRTQPAISQTIRKLEEEIGEPLLDRGARDGALTDAGALLREYAQRMVNLRGEARAALAELREAARGTLAIAANEFTSLYLLPVLDEYRRRHPMIRVTVRRALASHIAEAILQHDVEMGVVAFAPADPALRSLVVYRDALAFVVYPGHPLAKAREVSIRQLSAESFVAHNVPSTYRARVLQAFERHKARLNMAVELPTLEAIKKFVAMGNGVALVPGLCVESEVARGELVRVPVRELKVERKLRLLYRRQGVLSHAARAFLAVAQEMARTRGGNYLFQAEK